MVEHLISTGVSMEANRAGALMVPLLMFYDDFFMEGKTKVMRALIISFIFTSVFALVAIV